MSDKVVEYADLYKSLIRFCTQAAGEISLLTQKPVTVTMFDAIGDTGQLPDGDLLGFSDLNILSKSEQVGFYAEVMLVASVTEDTNLMRLETKIIDFLTKHTQEGQVIVIYKDTGAGQIQPVANLVFNGDRLVAPSTRDGTRTFKAIRCNLLCDKRLA